VGNDTKDSQTEDHCVDSDLENLIVSEYTEEEHEPGEVPEFQAEDDECDTTVGKMFLSKIVEEIQLRLTKKSDLLM
jgi:hypothetical protein